MRVIAMSIPAVVALTLCASAQEPDEATCPDSVSTVEIVDCLGTLYEEEDARLNAAYRAAIEPLEGERRTMLRDAQRTWVAFRDAHCAFMRSGDGTIAAIDGVSCLAETTRARADELERLGPV